MEQKEKPRCLNTQLIVNTHLIAGRSELAAIFLTKEDLFFLDFVLHGMRNYTVSGWKRERCEATDGSYGE